MKCLQSSHFYTYAYIIDFQRLKSNWGIDWQAGSWPDEVCSLVVLLQIKQMLNLYLVTFSLELSMWDPKTMRCCCEWRRPSLRWKTKQTNQGESRNFKSGPNQQSVHPKPQNTMEIYQKARLDFPTKYLNGPAGRRTDETRMMERKVWRRGETAHDLKRVICQTWRR